MSVNTFADAAAKLEDIELWMLPDIATGDDAARVEGEVLEIKLTKGPMNQRTLMVKASLDSAVCRNEHSGQSAWQQRWRNHAFLLYVRGSKEFDGPIEVYRPMWSGSMAPGLEHELPGSTVVLTALNWFPALARRRVIKTSTNAKWSSTDTPNRLFCQLVRENMVDGEVVTPTDWQQGSEVRHDFGDIDVACALPTAAGTSITHKIDRDINLLDALLEVCNLDSSDAEWLWPTESRSGTTVTFGVLRGRSGGSRQIGTDRSTIASGMIGGGPFSAERGNLTGYELEGDRVNKANHVAVLGKGRGAGQRIRYKHHAADIALGGVYEDVAPLPSGGDNDELDQEGQRFINERVASQERGNYKVIEIPGAVWPTHFDQADTVPIYTPLGESVTEIVLSLTWTLLAPGPARLELDLGPWPAIPERDLGRAGGGGRGGRGGGGKARSKAGESEVDPDSVKNFSRFTGQAGTDAVPDDHDDTCAFEGYDTADVLRAKAHTGDDPEVVKHEIIADFNSGDIFATGWIKTKDENGADIWLLATDIGPEEIPDGG